MIPAAASPQAASIRAARMDALGPRSLVRGSPAVSSKLRGWGSSSRCRLAEVFAEREAITPSVGHGRRGGPRRGGRASGYRRVRSCASERTGRARYVVLLYINVKQLGPLVAVLVVACGPDKTGSEGGGSNTEAAGTTGAGTTDGPEPTSAGHESTAGPVDPGEYGEMEQCMLAQVCETFVHAFGEDGYVHDGGTSELLEIEKCLLGGLRDGMPGRYVYGTSYGFTSGYETRTSLIHVHADRSVTFAVHVEAGNLINGGNDFAEWESYEPARTCKLVDPAFFSACLTGGDGFDHFNCIELAPWWTDCAELGPRCE